MCCIDEVITIHVQSGSEVREGPRIFVCNLKIHLYKVLVPGEGNPLVTVSSITGPIHFNSSRWYKHFAYDCGLKFNPSIYNLNNLNIHTDTPKQGYNCNLIKYRASNMLHIYNRSKSNKFPMTNVRCDHLQLQPTMIIPKLISFKSALQL